MTPTQLHQFLTIAEAGSLGRAARQLNISEPALSKRLKSLELSLGVPLMERTSRGMTPTAFGTCLAHHAQIIRGQFDRARENIAVMKDGKNGRLSIGFSPSFGPSIVADAVFAFAKKRPNVQITTREGLASDLMPLLLRSDIDLAVMTLDQRIPKDECSQVHLGTDPAYVIARPSHPLAGRKKIPVADILKFPWLMPHPGDRLRAWLESKLVAMKLGAPIPDIEFDSLSFARRMLAERDLLAFLPAAAMRSDLAERKLVRIAIPELRWERAVGIVHRQTLQSPLAAAMIETLKLSAKVQST